MPASSKFAPKLAGRHAFDTCESYIVDTVIPIQSATNGQKTLNAQDGKQNWLFKAMRAFSARNKLVQVAALPWRIRKGDVQVCLVTSRGTGRWILPKGWPEKDLSHAEAAAREAWEEAGLKGKADAGPCGEFDALKGVDEDLTVQVRLKVFLLPEPKQFRDFPEKGERKVKWLSLDKAMARVDEDGLRKLIHNLQESGAFKQPRT